jgi:glyoxylase-like metal-dependent hydrolase (beta-lactamase superfamily II)
MKIERFIGGNLEANGYIIYQMAGGAAWIIDPGYAHRVFTRFISENKLSVLGILLTHHHYDHSDEADVLRNTYDCPVCIHREDLARYRGKVDTIFEGGEELSLEEETIQVLHTPGHTAGGVCYYSLQSRVAFTGDTVFNVDLGRTDLPGGSPERLEASLRETINKWSNEIIIYPGHGDPCSMKYVREVNTEFIEMVL